LANIFTGIFTTKRVSLSKSNSKNKRKDRRTGEMQRKNTISDLLLFSVVLIFCGVIIYVAILLSSVEIGLTLIPLILFLAITYRINKKRKTKNHV
jgi:Flp pilus assembly protein TadB